MAGSQGHAVIDSPLTFLDLLVIGCYFMLIMAIGMSQYVRLLPVLRPHRPYSWMERVRELWNKGSLTRYRPTGFLPNQQVGENAENTLDRTANDAIVDDTEINVVVPQSCENKMIERVELTDAVRDMTVVDDNKEASAMEEEEQDSTDERGAGALDAQLEIEAQVGEDEHARTPDEGQSWKVESSEIRVEVVDRSFGCIEAMRRYDAFTDVSPPSIMETDYDVSDSNDSIDEMVEGNDDNNQASATREPSLAERYFLSGREVQWCMYFPLCQRNVLLRACTDIKETSVAWCAGRCADPDVVGAVGASLFASNIGSEHFIGLAGSGAKGGIAVSAYEWSAVVLLLLLGWVFNPIYFRAKIFTTPQYLEKRFHPALRSYIAVVYLLIYLFTKVSATLFAGAVVMKNVFGWNQSISSIILVLMTGLYTVTGGLSSVIYTEVLQTVVLLVGGFILVGKGWVAVHGLGGLRASLDEDFFHMWRPASDDDFPWPGVFFGIFINSLWYWCCDQVIVQRTLAAKDEAHAKAGTIMAGYLKLMTPVLMMARALYPEVVANNTDSAFPLLVIRILPQGLQGLVLASMLAALMSSLASVFNSSSTIMTVDCYQKLVPNATQEELLMIGRVAGMVAGGIFWIAAFDIGQDGLFDYIQRTSSYLQPPIAAVFLLGIVSPKVNAVGATAGLAVGGVMGLMRLVFGILLSEREIHQSFFPLRWFVGSNFLVFAIFLFVISVCAILGGTYLSVRTDHIMEPDITWSDLWRSTTDKFSLCCPPTQEIAIVVDDDVVAPGYAQSRARLRESKLGIRDDRIIPKEDAECSWESANAWLYSRPQMVQVFTLLSFVVMFYILAL